MSARPVISCESCRDLLMELVCEELPADKAAEVRAHAATCERCSHELAKLERTLRGAEQLPLLTPSPDVERRIMQAARAAQAGRAKGLAREQQLPEVGVAGWFARISVWAMSPQVAMASVLILVVGIGLYALPIGQAPDSSALRATEDETESSSGEAPAPSAAATAAPTPEPELLAEQRRNGSEAARQADGAGKLSDPYGDQRARKEAMGGPSKGRAATAKSGPYKGEHALGAARPQAEGAPNDDQYQEAKRSARSDLEAEPGSASSQGRGGFAPAPPAAAAPTPVEVQEKRAPALPRRSTSVGEKPGAPAAFEESASKDKAGVTDDLAGGIAASQRGDHEQATRLLEPVARSASGAERAQANLWLARSLRAQGECERALTYYRPLTQALTASREVLLEAADCFARTGNEPQASRLRARAQLPAQKSRQ